MVGGIRAGELAAEAFGVNFVAAAGWLVIVLLALRWCWLRDRRDDIRPFDWERDAPWFDDDEEAA
jgi:hypothetical protein